MFTHTYNTSLRTVVTADSCPNNVNLSLSVHRKVKVLSVVTAHMVKMRLGGKNMERLTFL